MNQKIKSEIWVCKKIRKMIQNETNLLKVAIGFGVNPTPLRKIMAGKPVSKYFIKKLYSKLKIQKDLNMAFLNSSIVKRFLSVYGMYRKEGTLNRVGQNLGLSRERVRQLLNKGTKLGLFDYKKIKRKPLPKIPKEKIIDDYHNLLRLRDVAKINKISSAQLSKLFEFYQIAKTTLEDIRIKGEKSKCVHQYLALVEHSGHHLSSSELQKSKKGHYLSFKITRYWGSIHVFRQELKIPFFPRHGKPFAANRSAKILKMRPLNAVKKNKNPLFLRSSQ